MKNRGFLRCYTKSFTTRFSALGAVVMAFVMLIIGIVSGANDISNNIRQYYNDYSAWDINISSTLGFTDDDIKAIAAQDYVDKIQGAVSLDVSALLNYDKEYDIRVYSVEFNTDFVNATDNMLSVNLIDGSYPMNDKSCIAVLPQNSKLGIKIGDVVYLRQGGNILNQLAFTVTGIAVSPEFVAKSNESAFAVYVPFSAYTEPTVYTDILLSVKGDYDADIFSSEYDEHLTDIVKSIEKLSGEREQARVEYLAGQQEANKFQIEQNYKEFENNLYSQLSAQKKALDEMKENIEKAEKEITEKETTLKETKDRLDALAPQIEALRVISEEKLGVDESEQIKQYDADLAQYEADFLVLNDAKSTLSADKTIYNDAEKNYKANKKNVQGQINNEKDRLENYDFGEDTEYTQVWQVSPRSDVRSFNDVKLSISNLKTVSVILSAVLVATLIGAVYLMTVGLVKKSKTETASYLILGYNGDKILGEFTVMAVVSALVGGIVGAVLGIFVITRAVYAVMGVWLALPQMHWSVPIVLSVITVLAAAVVIGETVYLSFKRLLDMDIADMYVTVPSKLGFKKAVQWVKNKLKRK